MKKSKLHTIMITTSIENKLADLLSVSRITIIRYVNEIKDAHEGKVLMILSLGRCRVKM